MFDQGTTYYCMMDTPESPRQSPQSPEEERALSDSELLGSVDGDADQAISDSEIVQEENDDAEDEAEGNQETEARLMEDGQEEDEVVPDLVSDPEEDEPIRDSEHEDKAIILMEDEEDVPGTHLNPEDEDEQKVVDTPLSPDFEPERDLEVVQEKVYSEEEDEDKGKADEEESGTRRTSVTIREMKDDAASVSRDLDEHELDYDEEVPEEPSVPPEEEEEEDEVKAEAETESNKRKEKKPILPPSPTDDVSRKNEEGKGRARRDSFRDKRDDDDGEIDEGEIDDDDLEEGEVKDPSDRKIRPRPICRFFMKGNCTWGMNCRFIHPGVNDKGNYSLITKPDPFSPNGAPPGGPHPLMPNNPWTGPTVEELPPPPPPVEPPVESAWERGLRHAKEVLKKATMRKEQEPDFEEKRFNVTIGEDEREFDKENEFFRERSYRIIRDEIDFRDPIYGDPYADPYYDYEMEALWRGGQYENFRVQYTEAPLPYHYTDRERERDPRERHRDRERERDHRERERRQRERERERERERLRRKDEWERDRMKRDDKEPRRLRPPREARDKKEEEKLKGRSPLGAPPKPMEPPMKKDSVPTMRRPDEWKDPWRRSKSPRRRPNMGSPLRGRRRHRPSGSSVSLSNSSRSSSRSSSYTGSGSSRSQSRSSSFSSYTSHSSAHSSFSGSRSRSRSFSSSPSRSPAAPRNSKNRPEPPPGPKGVPLKAGAMPPPRRDKPPMKKAPSPPPVGPQSRPPKPTTEPAKPPAKPPAAPRDTPATGTSTAVPAVGRPAPPKEAAKPPNPREGRRKERHAPRRRTVSGSVSGSGSSYSGSSSRSRSSSNSLSRSRSGSRKSRSLSVSSVSSVSSASSSSSSVRSADSDDMYADLASPVSSASSRSPSPGRTRKDRGAARDRPPHNRDKAKERPSKKEEGFKEERRKMDQPGGPPQRANPAPRSGPGSRGPHPSPGNTGPPASYGGSGSHKDIKLTLLNKQVDKGNRKRYLPSDKDRPGSPASKRMALSPDRGRDKRVPARAPPSPRTERPKAPGMRPAAAQGDRKRPMSPPPKSSGKAQAAPSGKSVAPGSASAAGSGSGKPSNTLSRREELLKQLKAVEDAIARKRAKMPAK